MSLKAEVNQMLSGVARLCDDCEDGHLLKDVLTEMTQRLSQPLRVAVSGIMKAGKSTFMNALMGEKLVYTGVKEATYTVCWFKYAAKPYIKICFKDGEELETEYTELEKWSVRESEKDNPRINDVKYLVIYYPNEILKQMEFIDTPGLNAVYGKDSQNTLDFLAVKQSEETIKETSMADAVIYAFQRSAGSFDEEILKSFQEGNNTSPINSVGILTRVDSGGIWDIYGDSTPVEAAGAVVEAIMKNQLMKQSVFSCFPVCAKPVEGFDDLTIEDWEVLKKLSKLSKSEIEDVLFDAYEFVSDSAGFLADYGNEATRKHILDSVDRYGIVEICSQLSDNIDTEKSQIKDILIDKCGISAVRNMLMSHFGNRTFLIKTQFIFSRLRKLAAEIRNNENSSRRLVELCSNLDSRIDEMMTNIQTLNELRILQYYYNGQLSFTDNDEREDFLQVTGEYGREPEKRLGISTSATMSELMNVAKKKAEKWHGKAGQFMMTNTYVDAATTIARSYEYMLYHLSALCDE